MRGDEFFREAARRAPFSKMHPKMASFFKEYLAREKVIRFNGQFVVNTHFPPYPGPAFDSLANNFSHAGDIGALEVHLLEPCATGRLSGRTDALLNGAERQLILDYQAEAAADESLPILSSYTYLESPGVFGCGAG